MRRPGLWVANGQPNDMAQMLSWKPGAVTCLYPHLAANDLFNYKAAHPEVAINVRFAHPRDWQQDLSGSARRLGQFIAGKWVELQPLDPYVFFASRLNTHYANGDPNPANQRLYTTPEFYQRYATWVRTTAEVIKSAVPDMKLVAPPLAFGLNEDGNPDSQGNPTKGWAGYDYLYETIRDYFDGRLAFQGYWGTPSLGAVPDWLYEPGLSSWYAFRWQRVLELFENRYKLEARIIIDEAGSFGPADPDFTDQLIYYAQQCLSDERVISLSYALWANPAKDPLYRANAWVEHIPDLEHHLARLAAMPDVFIIEPLAESGVIDLSGLVEATDHESMPEAQADIPEQSIRVLFEDGHVKTMPLETYLRAVVPAEMPALWPIEAVKAQAVASRTYAQYAIEHPKFPYADICTTTQCQHYDPAKIHARSDQAIAETRGLVLLYEGRTINAVFSANCGGHTRNNEDVWHGRPESYLRAVSCPATGDQSGHGVGLCQHGARVLAKSGQTYEEILRHYYQSAVLGPTPAGDG